MCINSTLINRFIFGQFIERLSILHLFASYQTLEAPESIILSLTLVFQTLTDVSECLSLQPLPPGTQYPYNYPAGQMGYWYPQGYPTAAQVQSQPFLGMQGFTYGQYGYQQG